jgi:putative CocE/NonD family hydrolase
MCAGWFDEDLIGTTEYWAGLEAHAPAHDRHLVIGPWTHGLFSEISPTLGEFSFGAHSVVDLPQLHRDFFDRYLRDHAAAEAPAFDLPPARIFVTGADEWRDLDVYPPREAAEHRLYLHSAGNANTRNGDGRLDDRTPGDEPSDRYAFDPADPARPSTPEEERIMFGRGLDQRAFEERADVLVYTTDPLERPIEAIGPAFVELSATTDGRDTDFIARLLDVLPDGRALHLGSWTVGGIIRARYRNGGPEEELLIPGETYAYRIELRHVGHRFLPGHRIRLEVTSSFAPLFRPNPNTGEPIATDTGLRVAQQQIHHRAGAVSALVLPVLPTGG